MLNRLRSAVARSFGGAAPPRSDRELVIGAIVYNEASYLLEWIAYHQLQGVSHFYIADNDSRDETTAMLEALQQLGLVTRLFQRRLARNDVQLQAYAQIIAATAARHVLVAFIDIDEFMLPTRDDTTAAAVIQRMLAPPQHSAMAINWRLFGSSGRIEPGEGLVIERFLQCAPSDLTENRRVKTIVKPERVNAMHVHRAMINGGDYLNASGEVFAYHTHSGSTLDVPVCDGELRLHHYRVKSLQEFLERKAPSGNATTGAASVRPRQYFAEHDHNDERCDRMLSKVSAVKAQIRELQRQLDTTVHAARITAVNIHGSPETGLHGHFDSDRVLADPVLCLTVHGDNEQAMELHAAATPDKSAGPAPFRYRFTFAALPGWPHPYRLRLMGNPKWLT